MRVLTRSLDTIRCMPGPLLRRRDLLAGALFAASGKLAIRIAGRIDQLIDAADGANLDDRLGGVRERRIR